MKWFKTKKAEEVKKAEVKTVKCLTCKHIVEEQDAQNVEGLGWFCEMHKKPYDKYEAYPQKACLKQGCKSPLHTESSIHCGLGIFSIYYYHPLPPQYFKKIAEVKIPEHYQEVTEDGKMLKKELKKK